MDSPLDHVTAESPAPPHNGHVPSDAALDRPPRPPGPSARPAALVFGIIFVLFVVGAVAAGLTGSSSPGPTNPRPSSAPVAGTGGLVAVPARATLAPVVLRSEPPADVVDAVVVPRGTLAVPHSGIQRGVGLYDASIRADAPATEQPLITFFRKELAAGRWHVVQAGSTSGGGYQILAQHPGSDGYEWELGVTMSATVFAGTPTLSVPPGGLTPMTLRLFAVSDQS